MRDRKCKHCGRMFDDESCVCPACGRPHDIVVACGQAGCGFCATTHYLICPRCKSIVYNRSIYWVYYMFYLIIMLLFSVVFGYLASDLLWKQLLVSLACIVASSLFVINQYISSEKRWRNEQKMYKQQLLLWENEERKRRPV